MIGLTDAELNRIVSRVPQIKECGAEDTLDCITKLKSRLLLTDIELKKKIVLRLPQCLGYDFERDIQSSLDQLESKLQLSGDELKSLILKCPQIIGLDYKEDIDQKINIIIQEVGGNTSIAKDNILKKPASLDSLLEEVFLECKINDGMQL